jgi:hypothetical protein
MVADDFDHIQPRIVGVTLFALLPVVFGMIAVPLTDRFVAATPPRDVHPQRTQVGRWVLIGASVLGSLLVSLIVIGAGIDSV